MIYAAGSLALAMLERLVQRRNLGNTLMVRAEVPDDMAWEDLMAAPPLGWQALGSPEAAADGRAWAAAKRTALFRVPSSLVPAEPNWVINPGHPDAAAIKVSSAEPLVWNPRLFGVPPA